MWMFLRNREVIVNAHIFPHFIPETITEQSVTEVKGSKFYSLYDPTDKSTIKQITLNAIIFER
jgi:hypothetical protein